MRDYIEINKKRVPYSFNILLNDQWFELSVGYNKTADLFTIAVYKDGELVCCEPLVLGVPLFKDIYQPGRFPVATIVPYDSTGSETRVTYENIGESVFLTIDNEGDGVDG
jgi:hypothetical protein